MIDKPAYGSPCNHCGKCCEDVVCPLGQIVLKQKDGPCPALERGADSRSACGLVNNPRRWAPTRTAIYGKQSMRIGAMTLIGGIGTCDALAPRETTTPEIRAAAHAHLKTIPRLLVLAAKKVWGIR